MAEQPFHDLVALFSAGLALILLGAVRLAAGRLSAPVRAAAFGAVTLGAALAPWALGRPFGTMWQVAVVAGVATAVLFLGTARLAGWVQAALSRLRWPGVQAAVLAGTGTVLAAGAFVTFDRADRAAIDRDMDYMLSVTYKPATREAADVATTDAGRRVRLYQALDDRPLPAVQDAERQVLISVGLSERVIRVAPAGDACNCHGWVFTGGRYWLSPDDVEHILADNGYEPVSDPRPGDLAVYRDSHAISHTSVVRTGGGGSPVLVEGKWGWMGVFLHRIEDSCYGTNYTYYRSPRRGHLLASFSEHAGDSSAVGQ